MSQTEFKKSESGKWTTEKCWFSISHSHGAAAVAVSRKPVGVDIEARFPLDNDRFAQRVLNEAESAQYESTPTDDRGRFLIEKWTGKEALFKRDGALKSFIPTDHDTLSGDLRTLAVNVSGKSYTLSVASESIRSLRIYEDIDLLSKI